MVTPQIVPFGNSPMPLMGLHNGCGGFPLMPWRHQMPMLIPQPPPLLHSNNNWTIPSAHKHSNQSSSILTVDDAESLSKFHEIGVDIRPVETKKNIGRVSDETEHYNLSSAKSVTCNSSDNRLKSFSEYAECA